MSAFYQDRVLNFLETSTEDIANALSGALIKTFSGHHASQLESWKTQINLLKNKLRDALQAHPKVSRWGVLFEYSMLRLQKRIDVVLLAGTCLVVIEFKVHKNGYDAVRQVEDYAFDLRDFHKESHELPILPVLCVPDAKNRPVEMVLPEKGQI